MASMAKNVANIVPGVMSIGLLGHSMQMIPKEFGGKADSRKGTANFLKGFTGIAVGVPMISATSDMVSLIP